MKEYKETNEDALQFLKDGGKCCYVYGLWNRSDDSCIKPTEWGIEKLSKPSTSWGFGMGFYTLNYINLNGETVLQFKELHENDLY